MAKLTWREFQKKLHSGNEAAVYKMLLQESSTHQRRWFMLHAHSRYNFLRAKREREEIKAIARD